VVSIAWEVVLGTQLQIRVAPIFDVRGSAGASPEGSERARVADSRPVRRYGIIEIRWEKMSKCSLPLCGTRFAADRQSPDSVRPDRPAPRGGDPWK